MCDLAYIVCFYTQCALYTQSVQFLDTVFEMYVNFCSALEIFTVLLRSNFAADFRNFW